ncbi:hypothetical protein COLO4_31345 [Corchorus olitorius]|uniref:Uncharacterized protein n=1 Tax=Corchorus olitorius TaxID=93759 RepID=A0A1R3H505_9ROSI|nr:hypothetical protein COLO4_31345 [Corchorus olitorius]
MASWRILACLLVLVILHSVAISDCRLLNPNIEGTSPTRSSSFRMLSLATSSGKVFNVEIRHHTNENLFESKRISPGASWSESRLLNPYIEELNPTRSSRALSITTSSGKVHQFSIPLKSDEYAEKDLYESKRLSPGGPDPKHH